MGACDLYRMNRLTSRSKVEVLCVHVVSSLSG
jgi:hypothetical protein